MGAINRAGTPAQPYLPMGMVIADDGGNGDEAT
jgi:hypothetical protein